MKIEDAIKQKTFRSEFHKLQVNIIYTANELTGRIHELMKPHGLTPEQYNVLRILRGQYPKPSSINLLVERMLDKMSNASRLVDKLLGKGLVERSWSSEDRRKAEVVITRRGLDLLSEIDKQNDFDRPDSQNISEEEAKELNRLLDKYRD